MTNTVISVENLSKVYRLGQIGTGTFTYDMQLWWARARGKPNPLLRIGDTDHGNRVGEELWALKDVSFKVEEGTVLGIIGRNGAGKSTLLKILSRVTAPTSGRIRVKGRIASLLEVGTGFHPELTGRENIYLNGAILGMKREEIARKFDEIVDFAEIEKFIDTPVKRYSSGMYVRLAFAVAAHLDPEILIVDEVLAVGDAAFQQKCLGKMGDVAHEGRTVLFVSHNMGAVRRLCQKALVLERGEIIKLGSTDSAIEFYLAQFKQKTQWAGNHINKSSYPLQVESIRILDSQGVECSRFPIGSKVVIELITNTNKSLSSSHIHIMVKYGGNILFRSFDVDDHPNILLSRPAGKYTSFMEIDTTWLKPGRYDLSMDTGIRPFLIFEKAEDLLFFELFDPEGDFDRGWSELREGVIKAPVKWEIGFPDGKVYSP